MLPELELRDVSREDVDRIAAWLDDSEVSSQWFGHYACGDPVHRGYEPGHMLEASDGEWQQVFRRDRDRVIASIYAEPHGHVGECQIVMHGRGEAELFLLIGRKELWHQGYGTAASSSCSKGRSATFSSIGPGSASPRITLLPWGSSRSWGSCTRILERSAGGVTAASSGHTSSPWAPGGSGLVAAPPAEVGPRRHHYRAAGRPCGADG